MFKDFVVKNTIQVDILSYSAQQVYLEGNRVFDFESGGYKKSFPIRISVHDPMSIANLDQGANVEVGYETTILITPSQIVTSPSAKGLPIEKRNCLFKKDSRRLEFFKEYTQANCFFECHLKFAYEKCQCVPWDFPYMNKTWPICDKFGRECFRIKMKDPNHDKQCNCHLDCATTRYAISLYSSAIDAKIICKNDMKHEKFLTEPYTGYPPSLIWQYRQIIEKEPLAEDNNQARCIERTKNMAIVRFEIADDIITRIKKTQRMTFADFVSNIGKQFPPMRY